MWSEIRNLGIGSVQIHVVKRYDEVILLPVKGMT